MAGRQGRIAFLLAASMFAAMVVLPQPAAALFAPTIASIHFSGLTSGALNPVAGSTASFTVTVVANDLDGYGDISSVTVGILKPDLSLHAAQAAATFVSNTVNSATYTKTLTMNFYDAPAIGVSTYKVKVIVTDAAGGSASNLATLTGFNYNQLVAILAPTSFDVSAGGVTPGSAGAVAALSIQNYGNVQIDVQLAGTDLVLGGNSIPVGDISHATVLNMADRVALTTTAYTLDYLDVAPGASSSKNVYLQLTTTPTGLPSGTYTGSLTVTAIAG